MKTRVRVAFTTKLESDFDIQQIMEMFWRICKEHNALDVHIVARRKGETILGIGKSPEVKP